MRGAVDRHERHTLAKLVAVKRGGAMSKGIWGEEHSAAPVNGRTPVIDG